MPITAPALRIRPPKPSTIQLVQRSALSRLPIGKNHLIASITPLLSMLIDIHTHDRAAHPRA